MINQESIDAIEKASFSACFVKPLYDSFCFSNIPHAIESLLTGKDTGRGLPSSCFIGSETYDMALLFFLDAWGWRFFEKYQSHPFCQRFLTSGKVSKLTSQFPSTTAAEVTSIHTGLEVGETGIYEWYYYEPLVDRMIAPLLFSYAGDKIPKSLLSSEIDLSLFFPFKTVYEKFHQEKISSYLFQHAHLSDSPYSLKMGKGAHTVSYFTLKQGLEHLKELTLSQKDQKTYALFYYADVDATGHRKGVDSPEMEKEILTALDLLEKAIQEVSSSKKIALMVTSDHGMTSVDPRTTLYLNEELPDLSLFLKKGKDGNLLTPAGSCRDFFLHVQEEHIEEALERLRKHLQEKAEVWKVSDLIELGLFGRNPSSRFLERVGNLVILPYKGESVWWHEKRRFEQNFYGAHGGLLRDEVEIPFLFTPLG